MEEEFEADEAVFKRDWFLAGIGRDATFDRLLVQIMAEIYSEKLAAANFRSLESRRQIVHSLTNGDAVRIIEETIPEEPEEEPALEEIVSEADPRNEYEASVEGEYDDPRHFQDQEPEHVSDDWPLTPSPPPSSSPHPTDDTLVVDEKNPFPKSEPKPELEPVEDYREENWPAWAPLRKRDKKKKKNKKITIVEPEPEARKRVPTERWPDVRHAASDEAYVYTPPTCLSPVYEEPTPLPLRPASASLLEGTSF
ncbi:hypothetical protein BDV28DRAFT_156982 [Aspergillus coremiiformis]|uniref:Uncharacterized protein n=1 Tax=Aspergillus coremiiformis TaxID=138285 RepID=A0A5N6Z765_9EURO|nr:hypothetical protein BDV28DRAFT_156982 [Aspergillus coremiiformis]